MFRVPHRPEVRQTREVARSLVEREPGRLRLLVNTADDVRHAAMGLELEMLCFARHLLITIEGDNEGELRIVQVVLQPESDAHRL